MKVLKTINWDNEEWVVWELDRLFEPLELNGNDKDPEF